MWYLRDFKCDMNDLKGFPHLNVRKECPSIDNEITCPLLLEILMKAFCNRNYAGVTRKQQLRKCWGKPQFLANLKIFQTFSNFNKSYLHFVKAL